MSCRVLVQSQGPLEGSVSDHHVDVVHGGLVLQDVMDFIRGKPGNILSVDLQNLITEPVNIKLLVKPSLNQTRCNHLNPPKAAGDCFATRQTNTPLLTAFTLSPIFPFWSLQRTT